MAPKSGPMPTAMAQTSPVIAKNMPRFLEAEVSVKMEMLTNTIIPPEEDP